MRKLFKKSLACILTAIICVSLCVVAVPASAATPTYSTNAVEAKAGETVAIDFTVSNFTDVQGAIIEFSLPSVVASISDVKLNGEAIDVYDAETGAGCYQVSGNSIKFLSLFGLDGEPAARDTLVFNITAVIADDAAEGTYTYPAPEFQIAQSGAIVDVTGSFGTFTIIPSVVEPVLDSNITISASVSITDSLGAGFFLKTAQLTAYDHYTLQISQEKYDGDYNKYVAETYEVSDFQKAGSTQVYYRLTGVSMYELGLKMTVKVLCYDADNNLVAYSNELSKTMVDLLKAQYSSTSKATTKTLVTDLLNLGAEAQKYFGAKKSASDLAKEELVNKDFDQTYATAALGTLNTVASTVYAANAPISNKMNVAVSLLGSPAVGYLVNNSGVAKEDLRMELTYHSNYLSGGSDVTDTVTGDEWITSGSYYTYSFSKTCLYDGNKTVTATLYYKDQLVLTNQYSVETYIANTKTTSSAYALVVALGKMSASARAYFGTT